MQGDKTLKVEGEVLMLQFFICFMSKEKRKKRFRSVKI